MDDIGFLEFNTSRDLYEKMLFLPRINVPELPKLRDRLQVC